MTPDESWRGIPGRVWAALRDEGPVAFWFRLLAFTVYRRVLLLEASLLVPLPQVSAAVPVVIGTLANDQLADYIDFRPDTDADILRDRLDAGHTCFVARLDGRIVSAWWAAVHRPWVYYLAAEMRLAPGDVYLYDNWTRPDARRRNISAALAREVQRRFHASGYHRSVCVVAPENLASLRALGKTGHEPCGKIARLQLGPWRWIAYRDQSRLSEVASSHGRNRGGTSSATR
jgi:ribosomal protein S18 acetylase RimI-like enzyme